MAPPSAPAPRASKIGILEGTWNVTPNSFINFKTTNFILKTSDHPDYFSAAQASFDANARLDVSALDTQGLFAVPKPRTGTTQPSSTTTPSSALSWPGTGTGDINGGARLRGWRFTRSTTRTSSAGITKWPTTRCGAAASPTPSMRASSGGRKWRICTASPTAGAPSPVPYNTVATRLPPNAGTLIYFQAAVNQQGVSDVPTIHSEYVGAQLRAQRQDQVAELHLQRRAGDQQRQALRMGLSARIPPPSRAGPARGQQVPGKGDQTLGHTPAPAGRDLELPAGDTVYANYARFVPAVSSLPRAASWDRNLASTVNVYFDRNGNVLARQTASSTGKLFAPDMSPAHTDEFLIGTTRDFGKGLSGRFYGRYRKSVNFWEDTNNGARVMFNPPDGIPRPTTSPTWTVLNQLQGVTNTNLKNTFVIAAAGRQLHQVLRAGQRGGVEGQQDLPQRLLHLEPLLRQLRPGQLHQQLGERLQHLRRAPPTSPTISAGSSGTTSTATSPATAGTS